VLCNRLGDLLGRGGQQLSDETAISHVAPEGEVERDRAEKRRGNFERRAHRRRLREKSVERHVGHDYGADADVKDVRAGGKRGMSSGGIRGISKDTLTGILTSRTGCPLRSPSNTWAGRSTNAPAIASGLPVWPAAPSSVRPVASPSSVESGGPMIARPNEVGTVVITLRKFCAYPPRNRVRLQQVDQVLRSSPSLRQEWHQVSRGGHGS